MAEARLGTVVVPLFARLGGREVPVGEVHVDVELCLASAELPAEGTE